MNHTSIFDGEVHAACQPLAAAPATNLGASPEVLRLSTPLDCTIVSGNFYFPRQAEWRISLRSSSSLITLPVGSQVEINQDGSVTLQEPTQVTADVSIHPGGHGREIGFDSFTPTLQAGATLIPATATDLEKAERITVARHGAILRFAPPTEAQTSAA